MKTQNQIVDEILSLEASMQQVDPDYVFDLEKFRTELETLLKGIQQ